MKSGLRNKLQALTLATALAMPVTAPAFAGTDAYLGELMLVGYSFCPRATLEANGQLLPISSNSALFSLYGTTYGGDGRTTFALPDLRGRVVIHTGQGPGLPDYRLGEKGGATTHTLTTNEMPSHNHSVGSVAAQGNKAGPNSDFLAATWPDARIYHDGPATATMDPAMIRNTGGGQAHNIRSPYLTMRWCVVTQGIFPSRS